ncbi:Tyrosinase central domain-containing protein [Penicillium ucsense]|uniref:Tyrosinase central domain-containing protein n=1 Tax=Penicillium ucsense TaxID=2839758 RepID=A0A8J8W5E6_9EURO|nr:Tyrosinase central domain-containing protein [Penicillium ucsense]KAF7733920.1 Tyrosinase central domain-containing protein [Penicillium ucsense]
MLYFWFLLVLPVLGHRCTPENRAIRREWGKFSRQERLDYIDGVHCMREKSPILPTEEYPGVRHRMDDFAATHINYTLHIHLSGIFFGWHRRFVWLWEKALREECGYQGHQPYWNWALSANNLSASPLFDGSDTSLSGDGEPLENRNETITLAPTNVTIPNGSGGGCVTNGPFANITLNLPDLDSAPGDVFPKNAFAYTPRCLTRNLNSFMAQDFTSQTDVDRLLSSPDIVTLQQYMDVSVWPELREAGIMGAHPAAHMQLGRAMDDFWTAPQEPAFMLHHAMVDRVWTLWQAQDVKNRQYALNGTSVMGNPPDAPEVNLDTQVTWGALGQNRTLRELMSTEAYEFCYEYAD